MTIEEDSVEFLQKHMDTSFAHLMGKFVVDEIEWLEWDELRPIARLRDLKDNKINIICLFPPFNPNN